MNKSKSDLLIAIGVFFLSYLIFAASHADLLWFSWGKEQGVWGVTSLPLALSVTTFGLAWFAWRRVTELAIAERQLDRTIECLKAEVEERKTAEEHASILSATQNEILENEYLRSEKLEQVRIMGDYLASATTLNELKSISIKCLKNIIPDHTVAVFFADATFSLWKQGSAWGVDEKNVYKEVEAGECWVLRRGQSYIDSSNTQNMLCDHANLTSIKSVACYPIFCREMQFGVLHLRSEQLMDKLLSSEDEKMVIAVCNTIGLHFYNTQLRNELSMASNRDALTGLLNRRGLANTFKREVQASSQQGYDVTVAMIDIDHFKKYNDSFGHQEGDKALKFVAETLAKSLRARDIVARYGGEEFIIILPDTSKAEAYKKLKAVIQQVALHSENSPECKTSITLSVGIATSPQDDMSEEKLVACADAALYMAKKRGRNCVIPYASPSSGKLIKTQQV